MKLKLLGAVLVALPQLATAGVFMCVDPVSGKTSFTDKACATTDAREEIRIDATNVSSGNKSRGAPREKTWRSEAETRKSGRDHNASRRNLYDNSATASTGK